MKLLFGGSKCRKSKHRGVEEQSEVKGEEVGGANSSLMANLSFHAGSAGSEAAVHQHSLRHFTSTAQLQPDKLVMFSC